jgi:choice-of-anchor C domain-containing protein
MKSFNASLAVVMILLLVQACSDQGTNAPFQSGPGVARDLGTVSLSFSNAPQEVTEVVATLTRSGFPTRTMQLTVSDSLPAATGGFANVAPGVWHLRVEARDSGHAVRYSGEADVNVQAGQTTQVTLQLVAGTGGGIQIVVTWGAPNNLLINGSFEQGPWLGTYLPLDSGSTLINGWVVSRGQLDLVVYWQAYDGSRSIDLNGTPGRGGIRQTFSTVNGATYRASFALAGNPEGISTPIMRMGVSAAGLSTEFSFDITGKSITNMGWQIKSWTFVAAGSSTTLEFYSLMSPYSRYGPVIDYVAVERVI